MVKNNHWLPKQIWMCYRKGGGAKPIVRTTECICKYVQKKITGVDFNMLNPVFQLLQIILQYSCSS